ncbi:hypothetical protein EYF80_029474 [Liparis tanakae]|uniref:Uncharacterized protein n=1 Tax=Liparis tanakae TaxID=230148 RepID=A0A4Z2H3J1_9TELE|nr:hypothetical protein EYF80_029474 [Liparis tanakae]
MERLNTHHHTRQRNTPKYTPELELCEPLGALARLLCATPILRAVVFFEEGAVFSAETRR